MRHEPQQPDNAGLRQRPRQTRAGVRRLTQLGLPVALSLLVGVAEVLVETGTLELGDPVVIIGPTTGVVETSVKELRVDEVNCERAMKGQLCSLPVEQALRRSDKVYKLESRP